MFLTGEVRFHDALSARGANVALILPGHYATERPAVEDLAAKLAADFPGVSVSPSHAERDPLVIAELKNRNNSLAFNSALRIPHSAFRNLTG